jgi:type II secretory pathway pseudopilin PulG
MCPSVVVKVTTVPSWTGVPLDVPVLVPAVGVLGVPGELGVPGVVGVGVVVVPFRTSTATISVEPFTGRTFVVESSVIAVPDGAVNGTFVQAPGAMMSAVRTMSAPAKSAGRAARSRGGSMRDAKDTTSMNARRSRLDDGGYILVALLISMAIAAVWLTAALPSWRQQVMREREAELIFRGEQYARAIRLYQQQMGGRLPSTLDDLVSQHTLRHKWKDPITDDEFLPKVGCLQVGAGGGIPTRGGLTPGGGAARDGAIPSGPGAAARQVGAPTLGSSAGSVVQPQVQRGGQIPGGFGQAGAGGICGVQSKSKATSIKMYNGQQEYDLWQFDTTTAALLFQRSLVRLGGGGSAGMGTPGGVGGRPGGPGTPPQMPGRGLPGTSPGGPGRGNQPITPPPFPRGRGRG